MIGSSKTPSARTKMVEAYLAAKDIVVRQGFGAEIDWQARIRFSDVDERFFLQESAWVVLSSGMREHVVRRKFPGVSKAFLDWRSAKDIVGCSRQCRSQALAVFNHAKKVDAILKIATHVNSVGFSEVKARIKGDGVHFLKRFPFIGPATCFHLAKNIGLDVVKPDRHLLRIAEATGYASPEEMCTVLAGEVGDRVSVVDLVIWRYATLDGTYGLFVREDIGKQRRGSQRCAGTARTAA